MTFPKCFGWFLVELRLRQDEKLLGYSGVKAAGISLPSQGEEAILVSQRIFNLLGDRMEPWSSAFLMFLLLLRWAYLLPKVPRKATLVHTALCALLQGQSWNEALAHTAQGLLRFPLSPPSLGTLHIQKLFLKVAAHFILFNALPGSTDVHQ